jgi:organic radical activating enzyme
MTEYTIEITNYCPHECSYCSSDAGPEGHYFLSLEKIKDALRDKSYERINISGGEPLAHPQFWQILQLAKQHAEAVVVYTNALTWICYNATVLQSGVRVDANVPISEGTHTVRVLKKVEQGREKERPEVKFSHNWTEECRDCGHRVLRYDGVEVKTPCNKYSDKIDKE